MAHVVGISTRCHGQSSAIMVHISARTNLPTSFRTPRYADARRRRRRVKLRRALIVVFVIAPFVIGLFVIGLVASAAATAEVDQAALEALVTRLIEARSHDHEPRICAWVDWERLDENTNSLRCPTGAMITELELRSVAVHGNPLVVGRALCCDSHAREPGLGPRIGTVEELQNRARAAARSDRAPAECLLPCRHPAKRHSGHSRGPCTTHSRCGYRRLVHA